MTLQHLSADRIRQRIVEIESLQRSHDARDMDAELRDVMLKGGDVDAMEAAQLEAERASRRLRVERSALEATLPQAVRQEADARIAEIHSEHHRLASQATKIADDLCAAWRTFSTAVEAWDVLQRRAVEITIQAEKLASSGGSEAPKMGNFRSAKVAALGKAALEASEKFNSAERETYVGSGVQSTVID